MAAMRGGCFTHLHELDEVTEKLGLHLHAVGLHEVERLRKDDVLKRLDHVESLQLLLQILGHRRRL